MIRELDCVVLTEDLPQHGLTGGASGVAVFDHGGEAFEVEFFDTDGRTIAVVTVRADQLRSAEGDKPASGQ
jgi:hypothetical protein